MKLTSRDWSLAGAAAAVLCLLSLALLALKPAGSRRAAAAAAATAILRTKPSPLRSSSTSYVSLCAAAKDEHCDIREWVLHHHRLGVRKFYLFDTASRPPLDSVLRDLIDAKLVHYQYVNESWSELGETPPGRSTNWQVPAFRTCLQRWGRQHHWMGFIDIDEYVVLQDGMASLPQLLQQYEQYGGLALHTRVFGTSGHEARPQAGTLRSYTKCQPPPDVSLIKSFVQPQYAAASAGHTHAFVYKGSRGAVDTLGRQLPEGVAYAAQATYFRAALHHYVTRSVQEMHRKVDRRAGDGSGKRLATLLHFDAMSTETCLAGVALGEQLQREGWDLQRGPPEWCRQGLTAALQV